MPASALSCKSFRCGNELLFFDEILIVKNVRRSAHQLEPNSRVALIAGWKYILAMHDDFMTGTVSAIMDYLIDPSFRDRITRKKQLAMFATIAHAAGTAAAKSRDCSVAVSANLQRFFQCSHFWGFYNGHFSPRKLQFKSLSTASYQNQDLRHRGERRKQRIEEQSSQKG